MKIQTNEGEGELTAAMVTRGMVFSADDRANAMTIGDGSHDEEGQRRAVAGCDAFLGCDPTIASRADCERFGVHGDAAAHGFARLRDGGAVDLRRGDIPGLCLSVRGVGRRTYRSGASTVEGDVFIGLDARHASPEDVRRLCCGEKWHETQGVHVCSLAIGDHDKHEDLATGVKWGARGVSSEKDKRMTIDYGDTGIVVKGRSVFLMVSDDPRCPPLLPAEADYGIRAIAEKHGFSVAEIDPNTTLFDGERPIAVCTTKGSIFRAGDLLKELRAFLPERSVHVLAKRHDGRWLYVTGAGGVFYRPEIFPAVHIGLFFARLIRRAQEAPLVALVNAVPEGLDPIGWRAAVLALHECQSRYGSVIQGDHFAAWLMHSLREDMDDCDAGTPYAAGYHGYLRAITPAAPVHRERTTWKTRGPVLAVDDGRDE